MRGWINRTCRNSKEGLFGHLRAFIASSFCKTRLKSRLFGECLTAPHKSIDFRAWDSLLSGIQKRDGFGIGAKSFAKVWAE